MATIVAMDQFYGDVILLSGACWEFIETQNITPTHSNPAAVFADCASCAIGSSSSNSSSSSSAVNSSSSSSVSSSSVSSASSSSQSSSSGATAMASCPVSPPNSDPTMEVTLTWTDMDTTKSMWGCSWTNGETKEVYSSTWTAGDPTPANTTSALYSEIWGKSSGAGATRDVLRLQGYVQYATFGDKNNGNIEVGRQGERLNIDKLTYTASPSLNYTMTTYSMGISVGIPATALTVGQPLGSQRKNNNIVTTSGITIAWVEGNGW